MNTYRFGMGCLLILTGLTLFIGVSDRFDLIGTIYVPTIEKLLMSGALSICMLVVLI